jgi:hypothetical protein
VNRLGHLFEHHCLARLGRRDIKARALPIGEMRSMIRMLVAADAKVEPLEWIDGHKVGIARPLGERLRVQPAERLDGDQLGFALALLDLAGNACPFHERIAAHQFRENQHLGCLDR